MASKPPSTPATSDPRDDAFIREVDEAYREDEMKQFFQRYGRWLILALGLGLAALGAGLWWQAEQVRRTEALSEQFSAALEKVESGSTTEAVESLTEIATAGNASYRSLSAFSQAGIALTSGDTDKAAALFKSVADIRRRPRRFGIPRR